MSFQTPIAIGETSTNVPFFLASNYVPDMEPKKRKTFLISEWVLVVMLLALLITESVYSYCISLIPVFHL